MLPMSETTRIADQARRAYAGKAWHGPSLKFLLRGVTAPQAAARPIPGAHTIWELVLHIAAWDRVAAQRIRGGKKTSLPARENFPEVTDTSDAAWKKTLASLEQANRDLRVAIAACPSNKLDRKLGGGDYSFYVTMHGAVQHDLYHAGQIAILKKMV
jgi:uncharacterized damage-inducible protein DinB